MNHSGDVFIHACRENPQSKGDFVGDKFHISIAREQVPLAFQILSGLLFSEDSPIDKWKITDMNRVSQQSRVGIGAQFTLYVKSDQECSQYSALLLHKIRQFIMCLESNLLRSKIAPGSIRRQMLDLKTGNMSAIVMNYEAIEMEVKGKSKCYERNHFIV